MDKRTVILEYKGLLTFSTIGRLLTQLKNKTDFKGQKVGVYKRILSVMIEALENIYKYSDQFKNDPVILKNYLPTFKLEREKNSYIISVSNPVRKKDAIRLKEKIDLVNQKSAEELKILYRQTISNGKFTEKGGAGLGIIEMAKISGNPLVYKFSPLNEEFDLYSLQICFT